MTFLWYATAAVLVIPILFLILLVHVAIYVKFFSQGFPRFCKSTRKLNGKTAIVTGANCGIGKETALDFAKRGARVILACRSRSRGLEALEDIKASCGHENVVFEELDLADYSSIRKFAERVNEKEDRLDILVNNAGADLKFDRTEKVNSTFALNHLGPFLLTNCLLDLMKKSAPSRIVNVASSAHTWGFTGKHGLKFDKVDGKYKYLKGYSTSKLANMVHANELTRRLQGTGVTANSLNPGGVATSIWRNLDHYGLPRLVAEAGRWFLSQTLWSCLEGAQTSIYCAVDEELDGVSGKYFFNCREEKPTKHANDAGMGSGLWRVSLELTGSADE